MSLKMNLSEAVFQPRAPRHITYPPPPHPPKLPASTKLIRNLCKLLPQTLIVFQATHQYLLCACSLSCPDLAETDHQKVLVYLSKQIAGEERTELISWWPWSKEHQRVTCELKDRNDFHPLPGSTCELTCSVLANKRTSLLEAKKTFVKIL